MNLSETNLILFIRSNINPEILSIPTMAMTSIIVKDKLKSLATEKKGKMYSMQVEGYCKKFTSPFLALNNLLLGLKGLGVDFEGSFVYNLAISIRSWGAGIAYLAFTAQSALKFFKPDLFGPKFKEIIKLKLNPQKEAA